MKGSAHRCIGPPRPQCDQAMESSTTNRDPLLRDRPSPDHPRESPRCGEPRQRLADGPQCPDNQTCSPTTTTAAVDEMPGFLVSKRCPPSLRMVAEHDPDQNCLKRGRLGPQIRSIILNQTGGRGKKTPGQHTPRGTGRNWDSFSGGREGLDRKTQFAGVFVQFVAKSATRP